MALFFLFRATFLSATLLSLVSAGLVVASHFIAKRAQNSLEFLGVSLVVSGVFVAFGLILYGVQKHVAAVARWTWRSTTASTPQPERNIFWLLLYLSLGGVVICMALASLAGAIVARIDQGLAVFG